MPVEQEDIETLKVRDITEERKSSRPQSRQRPSPLKKSEELEESTVQMASVAEKEQESVSAVDEAAVNATIKSEMEKINQSLARITQCLNVSRRG